ncbi:hypothetical protein [Bacteriovorax sp. Seq25_V]|uniref:hypothetical protein n=1 Tax=Bacteriovorax sp. Seq25_V TaxID=1201288 RepID=UPI00038A4061|nr:hypothetical protein [Bacteriovorax sp. Seq25_V]EQC43991.1 hypothetical protein M900_1369 [Bacteriovorax sp. Seq25_V]
MSKTYLSLGLLLLCLLLGLGAKAESADSFQLNGQSEETIVLDLIKSVTMYRDELQDSTCTRQEPYDTEECGYVTKYRQDCRYEPGRNVCRPYTDRICRYETRYRQECRTEPGRQQCRYEPGKTVCRTNSRGENNCRTIPGRQVCDTAPGRRVCRDVPYQDYVCRNETRNRCDYEPGRNVCSSVPYQEYECKTVTRYRSIPYACKITVKVPYQVDKKVEHTVNFNIVGAKDLSDATINVALAENGSISLSADNHSALTLLEVDNRIVSSSEYDFTSQVDVNVVDRAQYEAPLKINSHGLWMSKDGDYVLTVDSFSAVNFAVEIDVVTVSDGDRHYKKTFNINEFKKTDAGNGKVKLSIDLKKHGFKALKNLFGGVRIKVATTFETTPLGNVLGNQKPNNSREHIFSLKVYKD